MNMIVNFFVILFLLEWSECCSYSPYTYKYRNTDVSDQVETFPWLMVINDKTDSIFKLSYGALIHPQVVITSALSVKGFSAKNLSVETNCSIVSSWIPKNCIERQVLKIMTFKDEEKIDDYYEHNYALLILEHPLEMDVVKIAGNVNNINSRNCYFLRWMREISRYTRARDLITVKYKTLFNDGHLDVSNLDPIQLWTDRDFIISRAFHYRITINHSQNENFLNFMGSPLICQYKKNPEHYILAGIGTFNLRMSITSDLTLPSIPHVVLSNDFYKIDHKGSLINIIYYSEQILKYLDLKNN